jgi:hypothetical protein
MRARTAGVGGRVAALVATACLGTTPVAVAVEERPRCGAGPHAGGSQEYVPEANSTDPDIIRLGGDVLDMVLTDDFVYVLHQLTERYAPGSYRTENVAVSRVDRRSREVLRGDVLPATSIFDLAHAGGWLWVYVVDYDEAGRHCAVLYQIDPETLLVVDELRLPEPPPLRTGDVRSATVDEPTPYDSSAMGEAPDGRHLWVTLGRHLHRVDARRGRIVETEVSEEMIDAVAVDPKGRHVYSFSYDDYRVTKRHIDHGTVLRRSAILSGRAFRLTASRHGVWVGDVGEDEVPEIRLIEGDDLESEGRAGAPGRSYSSAAVSGETLWFSGHEPPDASGRSAFRLYCADAATGVLRSEEPQGPGGGDVVADDEAVYVRTHDELPDEQGIVVVHPDPVCLE